MPRAVYVALSAFFLFAAAPLITMSGIARAGIAGLPESATSENGLYRVAIRPETEPAGVGPIHVWLVTVTDPEGKPVEGARIAIDGGMPSHGHGLPTSPEMTQELAPGTYKVDGVKFSMIGDWELRFTIEAEAGTDKAVFAFKVE